MSIGEKIKELREARNMSLDDVAKLCCTTRQTIYKYENGIITNIPYDRIILLSNALNTTPAALLGFNHGQEENKISLDGMELTEGEIAFIRLLRRVPAEDKPVVIEKILSALDKQ
jgi:transcriptional regulator with XRE-family HTH domain